MTNEKKIEALVEAIADLTEGAADLRSCGLNVQAAEMEDAIRRSEAQIARLRAESCGACSGRVVDLDLFGVGTCEDCGGLNGTEPIAKVKSFDYVRSTMRAGEVEDQRYYDLVVFGSDGKLRRRHGWYDPKTREITQVG